MLERVGTALTLASAWTAWPLIEGSTSSRPSTTRTCVQPRLPSTCWPTPTPHTYQPPHTASPRAAPRYFLLLAFAALLVAAPLVRCQDDDDVEEEFVDAEETVVSEPAAATTGGSVGGYADMATEYLNTATELGKQYASQAAEVAQQYLGSYGVSRGQD